MLADVLQTHHDAINQHFCVGYANWNSLIHNVKRYENEVNNKELEDEQIWTFLLGCGYATAGAKGVKLVSELLTGAPVRSSSSSKLWFEVLPIPPRKNEGNTHLDLALGSISNRNGTRSGIQLLEEDNSWICFCEMKWNSDISTTVTYDLNRNQLVRVIENALCFQDNRGRYAEEVFVTLVTPAMFYNNSCKSRLYQYKFSEYNHDAENVLKDLQTCSLKTNYNNNWKYPEKISARLNYLNLNWITYEHLFENLPDSVIADELKSFWQRFRKDS